MNLSGQTEYSYKKHIQEISDADINNIWLALGEITGETNNEEIINSMKGKLQGGALRVPVIDGSLVDLTLTLKKEVTKEEIEEAYASEDKVFISTLEKARDNIHHFHSHQVRNNFIINGYF